MNITEFKNIPVCYPKSGVDLARYEIPYNKSDFFTTKYSEFDFAIPKCEVEGLNLELGVFKGRSLRYLADTWKNKFWFGFDTFEGVDEIWDLGQKSIDMKSFKIPSIPDMPNNVMLIKGLFQDTLNDFIEDKDQPISFLNLDADIYSAVPWR